MTSFSFSLSLTLSLRFTLFYISFCILMYTRAPRIFWSLIRDIYTVPRRMGDLELLHSQER